MTSDERKFVVPNGGGDNEEVKANDSGRRRLKNVTARKAEQKDIPMRLVRASELSLEDDFLQHFDLEAPEEKAFKEAVEEVINDGVQDFYRPTLDPSFDGNGQLCYRVGMMPAVGMYYSWWLKNAKKLGGRLGTRSEYIAFLAVLIKELVDAGKTMDFALHSVCSDSKWLGHYWNSSDAKNEFEATGKREVCGWHDLANTFKILDAEDGDFWLAGGCYCNDSEIYPLAKLQYVEDSYNYVNRVCCGWIVFP